MKKSEVIAHYGTQVATAMALGIDQGSISAWGEYPPAAKQLLIERLTKGTLVAEPGCLEKVIGMDKVPQPSAVAKSTTEKKISAKSADAHAAASASQSFHEPSLTREQHPSARTESASGA